MSKVEEYRDRISFIDKLNRKEIVEIENALEDMWNEAIKECEGCVPEELPEVTLQDPHALERNMAHNSCREKTLQAIRQMAYKQD